MQAAQLPEPAAVPVQRPASPALAPVLRTISGETPHYRARFEVAAADGADAAEAVKEIVMGWLHAKGLDVPEGAARGLDGRRRARRRQGRPLSRPIRRARRGMGGRGR